MSGVLRAILQGGATDKGRHRRIGARRMKRTLTLFAPKAAHLVNRVVWTHPEVGMSADAEILAQIDATDHFIGNDFVGCAAHQDFAVVQDIGAVNDFERFAHVVIGDENADAATL